MVPDLAKAVLYQRKRKGLSQKKLAELSGLSESFLWRLEKDHRPNPSIESIIKLSKALDITIDELVFGTPASEDD